VDGLGFLGLAVDHEQNEVGAGDRDVGAAGAPARVLVVESREDLEIARSVRRLLDLTGEGVGPPQECRPAA
jgi:acetate kinase